MSRYYEESEIMKALDSNLVGTYYGLVLNVNMDEFLDGVPTADVVEVVRCKYCTRQMICFHSDDYFCADGERREDDDN